MSRAVALWIGKTDDSAAPPRVRLRLFLREGGICFLSKRPIAPGEKWECHHRIALINGGRNSEDNLVPVLVSAHKAQTKLDVAEKSRVADRAKSHFGVKQAKRSIPSRPKPPHSKRDQLPIPVRRNLYA